METFDIVVMVVGVLLIVAGVVIFISGKVVGSNNKVEAFGVKMDVNNPSMLLVAVGVGLLLVPRLLPGPKVQMPAPDIVLETVKTTETDVALGEEPTEEKDNVAQSSTQTTTQLQKPLSQSPQKIQSNVVQVPTQRSSQQAEVVPAIAVAPPVPQPDIPGPIDIGHYELLSHWEDGEYLPVSGVMDTKRQTANKFRFDATYQGFNDFGMLVSVNYKGTFRERNGSWFLRITNSNDPEWDDVGEVPVNVSLQGNTVSMAYNYDDTDVVVTWARVR